MQEVERQVDSRIDANRDRRGRWPLQLWAILALAALVRIIGLGSDSFWLDEAYTARYTTFNPARLWHFDPPYDRANPPGYILLMKLWAQVSRSDEWLRASSVLAGVLTVAVVYLICVRMGSRRAGLMASLLLALSGYHIRYSQEARAYAILTLLVAVALLSVVQLISEPDGRLARPVRRREHDPRETGARYISWTDVAWVTYGISVGVALHLHNTSLTIPFAANIGVGIWWLRGKPRPRRFARNWVLANVLALAVWAPWIPGFINQVLWIGDTGFSAASPLSWGTILGEIAVQAKGNLEAILPASRGWVVNALLVAGVMALVVVGLRLMDRAFRPLIVALIVVHPTVEFLFSLRRPVFLARSLLWIIVPTLVAIGFSVSRLRGVRLAFAAGALVMVPMLTTVSYHVAFDKTPWDQGAALLAEEARDGAAILVVHSSNTVPFRRYFDEYERDVDVYGIPRDLPKRTNSGLALDDSDFVIIESLVTDREEVWMLLNRAVLVDRSDEIDPMLRAMFTDVEVIQMDDLTVIHYTR